MTNNIDEMIRKLNMLNGIECNAVYEKDKYKGEEILKMVINEVADDKIFIPDSVDCCIYKAKGRLKKLYGGKGLLGLQLGVQFEAITKSVIDSVEITSNNDIEVIETNTTKIGKMRINAPDVKLRISVFNAIMRKPNIWIKTDNYYRKYNNSYSLEIMNENSTESVMSLCCIADDDENIIITGIRNGSSKEDIRKARDFIKEDMRKKLLTKRDVEDRIAEWNSMNRLKIKIQE